MRVEPKAELQNGGTLERHEVSFGRRGIAFVLRRTARRTLAITVKPDTSVVVTAPRGAEVDAVKVRVRKRAMWIRRQQEYFSCFLPKLPPRRYMSGRRTGTGEAVSAEGDRGPAEDAKLRGRFIEVETARKDDNEQVRRLVEAWYLQHANLRFARSLDECLPRFPAASALGSSAETHAETLGQLDSQRHYLSESRVGFGCFYMQ
jgi:predicted metal-dependent hydrolase